jgi:cell division protein FtsB
MKRTIISFLTIIAVYTVINLALVGGQKLWHHRDQVNLDTLKARLDSQRSEITQCESELNTLNASSGQSAATIANLKSRVHTIEQQYPSGIPPSIYYSYSQLIDQCNSLVASHNETIARYNALYDDYSQRVERYNAIVKDSNAIARQIGVTWYVIPVPAPRYSHEQVTTRPRR